jgi:hypothetical protein
MPRLAAVVMFVVLATARASAGTVEDGWLAGLTDRVVADLVAGKPLAVSVHVPLCDQAIIPCGNAKLGDGDNPATNLYWATTPGFGRWFGRAGSGWKRTIASETGDADVLALHVVRRTHAAPTAWRRRGVPKTFAIEITIRAWRGSAIDRGLAAYAAELASDTPAHLVAWVGHNRLMDVARYRWPATTARTTTKGAIAIACHTAVYMETTVSDAARVPLLMTRDLLFANAAPLEATVLAFAAGGTYAQIRSAAVAAYAKVRERPAARVAGAFTNPADRRWARR